MERSNAVAIKKKSPMCLAHRINTTKRFYRDADYQAALSFLVEASTCPFLDIEFGRRGRVVKGSCGVR
jgi:hypothetical protein